MTIQLCLTSYKKITFVVGFLILAIVFCVFLYEQDHGWHKPQDQSCIIENGTSEIYIHWFKPLNNTYVSFCNGSASTLCVNPKKYSKKTRCQCAGR